MDFYMHYAVHNRTALHKTVPENSSPTSNSNDSKSILCILLPNQSNFRKIREMFATVIYIR